MALMHLAREGVTVHLKAATRVEGSSGYYCFGEKVLSVATEKPFDTWFLVFIHEYCHFLQVMDPTFSNEFPYKDFYWSRYFDWLEGKRECSPKTIAKYVHGIREVEMDCERRVISLIEEHDLPIDIGEYTQKANAYGYFYTLTKETRAWYAANAPSDYSGAYSLLSTEFAEDYEKVPEDFRKIVLKNCF